MAEFDVIVVGTGNAGFCAAHAAAEGGAKVLVVEKAPEAWAGGNTYFTQGFFRAAIADIDEAREILHEPDEDELAITDLPPYSAEDFFNDLMSVTRGRCDKTLGHILADESNAVVRWMKDKGIHWQLSERRSFRVDGRIRYFGGGGIRTINQGKGLIAQHTEIARKAGTVIRYDTAATDLVTDRSGKVVGLAVETANGREEISADAVVLASGGFGANPAWRTAYLGPGWDAAMVRGTPYNMGDGLRMAIDIGARPHGNWSGCHAVSWDPAGDPDRGDRNLTNSLTRGSYMLGLIVNNQGKRFVDEGENFRNYTYAKYGGEVLKQPGSEAFHLFDAQTRPFVNKEYEHSVDGVPPLKEAATLDELAALLNISAEGLKATVAEFNAAAQPGHFDPSVLDGKRTAGLFPPKSNWAVPLSKPPFYGCRVVCGMTFTYGGIKISTDGEVAGRFDTPIPGLYAAGEMVGGIFYFNYPGGSGLTSGAVFGRRAGAAAARFARA
jgi:tricarballylate dehydrogenase